MRLVVCGWVGAAEPDAIAEVERQVMMRGPSWFSTEILGIEYALERQGRGLVQLVACRGDNVCFGDHIAASACVVRKPVMRIFRVLPSLRRFAPLRIAVQTFNVQLANIQSAGSAWQSEFRREMSGCAREWARRAA